MIDITDDNGLLDWGRHWKRWLKAHPNGNQYTFCYARQHFMYDKRKTLQGITKNLQQLFYPNFKYQRLQSKTYKYTKPQFGKNFKVRSLSAGQYKGKTVHKEICDFVNKLCSDDEKQKQKWNKRYVDGIFTYTAFFIAAMDMYQIEPIIAELPVGDHFNGVATAVDILYTTPEGDLGVMEVKTGYNGAFNQGNDKLDLADISEFQENLDVIPKNSPEYQAKLQLTLTVVLLEKTYGITPKYQKVLHIFEGGVHQYDLDPWFMENRQNLYNAYLFKRQINSTK